MQSAEVVAKLRGEVCWIGMDTGDIYDQFLADSLRWVAKIKSRKLANVDSQKEGMVKGIKLSAKLREVIQKRFIGLFIKE